MDTGVLSVFLEFGVNVLMHCIARTTFEVLAVQKVVGSEGVISKQFRAEAALRDLVKVNKWQREPRPKGKPESVIGAW